MSRRPSPEGFFSDVSFDQREDYLDYNDWIEFRPVERMGVESMGTSNQAGSPIFRDDDLIEDGLEIIFHDEEEEGESWDEESIRQAFADILPQVQAAIAPLIIPLDKIMMIFGTVALSTPIDDDDREAYKQAYGRDFIPEKSLGNCERMTDGTFRIQISALERDPTPYADTVLMTVAHEVGHTLGTRLDNLRFEELKAYAFANLCMRIYSGGEFVLMADGWLKTHAVAIAMLEQLCGRGIPEEAILAHLTGQQCGQFGPDDYRRYLG